MQTEVKISYSVFTFSLLFTIIIFSTSLSLVFLFSSKCTLYEHSIVKNMDMVALLFSSVKSVTTVLCVYFFSQLHFELSSPDLPSKRFFVSFRQNIVALSTNSSAISFFKLPFRKSVPAVHFPNVSVYSYIFNFSSNLSNCILDFAYWILRKFRLRIEKGYPFIETAFWI